MAALAAQFAADFAISSLRFSASRGAGLRSQLRETVGLWRRRRALRRGARRRRGTHGIRSLALALLPLLGLLALFAKERHERLTSLIELNNAYRGTALVLGDVVEADDGYTGEHCKSVVALALEVGATMGLDAEQRRNLEFARLAARRRQDRDPQGDHQQARQARPRRVDDDQDPHVEGQQMLDRVGGFMRDVGMIVRSHHERWDGGGYPDGLAGEAIPLEARIITVLRLLERDAHRPLPTARRCRRASRLPS